MDPCCYRPAASCRYREFIGEVDVRLIVADDCVVVLVG